MDWRHQAACRDHDPELWFSGKPYEQAAALAICRSCPVIGECSAREQLDQQEARA
ncbi:WhiB family transcriptional regulator [Bifidobacterium pseudocatenulatum]|uniref:WhiB family transcriptional regulator n=1 Tax=Bifidobacterium pseudocatenulatum TaxID=28026 RepID=A0AAW4TR44_BIFPS|nr:WhiB family transcriptional regulator [Bifidobacterium pseudocatenulatum]MCB4865031.1 WhiB family transcriptional regulator [Bifidobacterium pseudocatenulatum]MCB4880815.1 WhiB family transcriptional regulator [Bifidobacterium pseudocatenulatum]